MSNTTTTPQFIADNAKKVASLVKKNNAQASKSLETLLEIGRLMAEGLAWFNGEGKSILKDTEGKPYKSTEQFINETYGYQKGSAYKLIKAASHEPAVVQAYLDACDEAEAKKQRVIRSIESLNAYAKQLEEQPEQGEGEAEGEGEGEEPKLKEKPILVLTARLKDVGMSEHNVSMRATASGEVTTSASLEDVKKAYALLGQIINQMESAN